MLATTQQREIALVRAHRRRQHLGRQFHERIVDAADMRDRPFDETRDLVEQFGIVLETQAMGLRSRPGLALDLGPALDLVQDHMRGAQQVAISGGAGHVDGSGGQEAVPHRRAAEGDDAAAQIDGTVDDLAVEQRHHGMQRPDPGLAVRRPAHRFRPRECGHRAADRLRGRRRGGDARDAPHIDPRLALAVAAPLAIRKAAPVAELAQEALHGLVGGTDPRALDLFDPVGGRERQPLHDQGETARRGEGARGGPGEADALQRSADQTLQILAGAGLHAGGDLLGEELDQQVSHCRPSGSSATARSTTSPARARGRYRPAARRPI
jgi:hypothetical protein